MTKAVFFDLDGTLVNSIYDLAEAGNYALEKVGLEPYELERYNYFVGNGIPLLIERIVKGKDRSDLYTQVYEHFEEYYSEHYVDKTLPYDGISELLAFLKNKRIKIGVVSNKAHKFSVSVVDTVFGKGYFDMVLGQREGIPSKPAPDAVFEMMKAFGVTADECLYVGDTGVDMQTGNNAGIKTIGVLWGFRTKEELVENNASVIVSDAKEIENHVE